jgi:hypothetical protein
MAIKSIQFKWRMGGSVKTIAFYPDRLLTSLGEFLAEKSIKNGFWIQIPPRDDPSPPKISFEGVQHPLLKTDSALQSALNVQKAVRNIRVLEREAAGTHILVLEESSFTPSTETLTGLETGRVIESGKLFFNISPPDEATIDIALDLAVTRTERKMGYFLLFHETSTANSPILRTTFRQE